MTAVKCEFKHQQRKMTVKDTVGGHGLKFIFKKPAESNLF